LFSLQLFTFLIALWSSTKTKTGKDNPIKKIQALLKGIVSLLALICIVSPIAVSLTVPPFLHIRFASVSRNLVVFAPTGRRCRKQCEGAELSNGCPFCYYLHRLRRKSTANNLSRRTSPLPSPHFAELRHVTGLADAARGRTDQAHELLHFQLGALRVRGPAQLADPSPAQSCSGVGRVPGHASHLLGDQRRRGRAGLGCNSLHFLYPGARSDTCVLFTCCTQASTLAVDFLFHLFNLIPLLLFLYLLANGVSRNVLKGRQIRKSKADSLARLSKQNSTGSRESATGSRADGVEMTGIAEDSSHS